MRYKGNQYGAYLLHLLEENVNIQEV